MNALETFLFTPLLIGFALLLASVVLSASAVATKRRSLARVALRTGIGGLGFIMFGAGMGALFSSGFAFLAVGYGLPWLLLLALPLLWIVGSGLILGCIKSFQWAIRDDRDAVAQWWIGGKVPSDWT